MSSITVWTRIEPRTRRADVRPGLEAPIEDPLWMLGRQEQLGAFEGEDAPTPIGVVLDAQATRLTRFSPGLPGAAPGAPFDSSAIPLETLVEREPARRSPGAGLRVGALAGVRFSDFLAAEGVAAYGAGYRDEFPLRRPARALDDAAARFLDVTASRVPDGNALYAALRPAGTPPGTVMLPGLPAIAAADVAAVTRAAGAWTRWYDGLVSVAGANDRSWVRERMEYSFSVAAPDGAGGAAETVLVAREHTGGGLDWYSFDEAPGATLGAAGGAAPTAITRRVLATPIAFGGMPSARWFEFEDGRVNFGRVDAGPPDLARMLLIEFAALYGNDHFAVPIELDVGSLCRVTSLVVLDNFGGRTRIRPSEEVATAGGVWQMFRIARDSGAPLATTTEAGASRGLLFLPPTLGSALQGAPVEEVLFARDEMANFAWAIERIVESPTGDRLNRYETFQEERRRAELAAPAVPLASTEPFVYTLETEVPPHWIPLLPVQAAYRQTRLQLREMLDNAGTRISPQGMLLSGTPPLELFEEEVPRSGARVRRAYQYARWVDGSSHLWLGREKEPGRGEGSSGLRFDVVESTRTPP